MKKGQVIHLFDCTICGKTMGFDGRFGDELRYSCAKCKEQLTFKVPKCYGKFHSQGQCSNCTLRTKCQAQSITTAVTQKKKIRALFNRVSRDIWVCTKCDNHLNTGGDECKNCGNYRHEKMSYCPTCFSEDDGARGKWRLALSYDPIKEIYTCTMCLKSWTAEEMEKLLCPMCGRDFGPKGSPAYSKCSHCGRKRTVFPNV